MSMSFLPKGDNDPELALTLGHRFINEFFNSKILTFYQ